MSAASLQAARARPRDPTVVQRVVVPPANRAGPTTSTKELELPRSLGLVWQSRVPGTIAHAAAVTPEGGLIVASTGGITELAADGTRRFTRNLDGAIPVCQPAVGPDGTRVVVTSAGSLVALSHTGAVAPVRPLAIDPESMVSQLVFRRTGTVLIGAAGTILEVTLDGEEVDRAQVGRELAGVLEVAQGVVLIARTGEVLRWRAPEPPRQIGSFGGVVHRGAAVTGADELTAIVGQERLVSISLTTGARRVRFVAASAKLLGPPVVLSRDQTRVLTTDGVILGHDRGGVETHRTALLGPIGAPAGFGARLTGDPPPVLVDRLGATLVAWPGHVPMLVDPDGRIAPVRDVDCVEPIAVHALPPSSAALVCASGVVTRLGPMPRLEEAGGS